MSGGILNMAFATLENEKDIRAMLTRTIPQKTTKLKWFRFTDESGKILIAYNGAIETEEDT